MVTVGTEIYNIASDASTAFLTEGDVLSVKDLTIITNACLSNQTIMDIVSKSSIYCTWENGKEVTYHNTNELLNPESTYYYSGVFGMKTGYGDSAGACIISVVNINGSNYICTVMNSNDLASPPY